jgi:hypothetical protein
MYLLVDKEPHQLEGSTEVLMVVHKTPVEVVVPLMYVLEEQ